MAGAWLLQATRQYFLTCRQGLSLSCHFVDMNRKCTCPNRVRCDCNMWDRWVQTHFSSSHVRFRQDWPLAILSSFAGLKCRTIVEWTCNVHMSVTCLPHPAPSTVFWSLTHHNLICLHPVLLRFYGLLALYLKRFRQPYGCPWRPTAVNMPHSTGSCALPYG